MKINGHHLKEALKLWDARRTASASLFDNSLTKFATEEKRSPEEIMGEYLLAEDNISKLQTEQMRYNLAVQVKARGEEMPLARAIKKIGGISRAAKSWKAAASVRKLSRYETHDPSTVSRSTDTEYATRTISYEDALELSEKAGADTSAFRIAISSGNAQMIDSDLDTAIFCGVETGT